MAICNKYIKSIFVYSTDQTMKINKRTFKFVRINVSTTLFIYIKKILAFHFSSFPFSLFYSKHMLIVCLYTNHAVVKMKYINSSLFSCFRFLSFLFVVRLNNKLSCSTTTQQHQMENECKQIIKENKKKVKRKILKILKIKNFLFLF